MNRLERIARQKRRSIEVPGSGLESYLRMIVEMFKQNGTPGRCGGYYSIEHLVLRQGRPMTRIVYPGPLMTRGECFRNAALAALEPNAKVIYCEGYAHTGLIPIHHAWLITPSGAVMDPTWGMEGLEYFGVAFNRSYVRKIIYSAKVYGLLHQPDLKWPVMTDHPKAWRHEIMDRLPLPEAEAWP